MRLQVVLPPGGEKSGPILGRVEPLDIEPHCGVPRDWIRPNCQKVSAFRRLQAKTRKLLYNFKSTGGCPGAVIEKKAHVIVSQTDNYTVDVASRSPPYALCIYAVSK